MANRPTLSTLLASALCLLATFRAGASPAASPSDSPAVLTALPPLSVRGINYYPRATPWSGMWTKTDPATWEADMALAASLKVNTIRTFLPLTSDAEKAGLLGADGTPTPAYLAKIETLLAAAWKHRIRVILCFDPSPKWLNDPARWPNALRGLSAPRRGDGRLLAWDLMNEPESEAKWTDSTRAYLRGALPLLRETNPGQLTTVGLTWRADRLASIGVFPDVWQYHEYHPKQVLIAQGWQRAAKSFANQRKHSGPRPLLVGEFGLSTSRDPKHGCDPALAPRLGTSPGTEAEQVAVMRAVLEAAEREKIAGTLPWCLHDYPIRNPDESHFGLFRSDGSAKPAAALLRETYARWAAGP